MKLLDRFWPAISLRQFHIVFFLSRDDSALRRSRLFDTQSCSEYASPQRIATGHQDTVHDMAMDYYGKRISMASSDHNIKIIGVSTASSQDLATLNSQSQRTRLGDIMGSPQIRVYACFMLVRWPGHYMEGGQSE
ncbi:hypothetical protein SAY86_017265 [Trapa natans]|uniref:Uncharacterized protein n=1 Tax=Trapa natans TaxID=22666 RepID=A0AAN7R790_TRANT|nr:hypothetical protein SAY86_017265 [Trapa natans]